MPDERRRRLEEQLALACFYLSDFGASGDAFGRAAERSADLETRGVNLAMSGYSFFWAHQFERADTVVDTAMTLARRHHLIATEALAISHRGFFRGVCRGDVDFEEESMRAALGLAQASGAEAAIALIRFNQAQVAEWTGDCGRAQLGSRPLYSFRYVASTSPSSRTPSPAPRSCTWPRTVSAPTANRRS